MIQRVVLIRLHPQHRNDADRRQIAEHAREVLGPIPLLSELSVAPAADARTRGQWDLVVLARLADFEAAESYRVDRTHRAFADLYLKPLAETVRVFHFEVE
ncbi:MAG TPA: Dabb family protein [Thermoanaerobaculia bacterium]|nr:Dabb family protein [Thermoanaerobaculia bacterium]